MSTALAAAVALYFFWKKSRGGVTKPALISISISLWWLDLFTYTLPTWGIRRSILWGARYSEPYQAAVALGLPGLLFQSLVIAAAAFFSFALFRILRRDEKPRGRDSGPRHGYLEFAKSLTCKASPGASLRAI